LGYNIGTNFVAVDAYFEADYGTTTTFSFFAKVDHGVSRSNVMQERLTIKGGEIYSFDLALPSIGQNALGGGTGLNGLV
jgi:hypothetical protein